MYSILYHATGTTETADTLELACALVAKAHGRDYSEVGLHDRSSSMGTALQYSAWLAGSGSHGEPVATITADDDDPASDPTDPTQTMRYQPVILGYDTTADAFDASEDIRGPEFRSANDALQWLASETGSRVETLIVDKLTDDARWYRKPGCTVVLGAVMQVAHQHTVSSTSGGPVLLATGEQVHDVTHRCSCGARMSEQRRAGAARHEVTRDWHYPSAT